jgi:hypothetical protein
MIFPLNGQKQLSTGATWQVEVTAFPLLSSAVQLVQCEVTLALAGLISNARLKITAQRLTRKSTFLFTWDFSFCPSSGRMMSEDQVRSCGGGSKLWLDMLPCQH